MRIQVNIPDELNKKLKVYRIEKDFSNMQEALIEILNKFFGRKRK